MWYWTHSKVLSTGICLLHRLWVGNRYSHNRSLSSVAILKSKLKNLHVAWSKISQYSWHVRLQVTYCTACNYTVCVAQYLKKIAFKTIHNDTLIKWFNLYLTTMTCLLDRHPKCCGIQSPVLCKANSRLHHRTDQRNCRLRLYNADGWSRSALPCHHIIKLHLIFTLGIWLWVVPTLQVFCLKCLSTPWKSLKMLCWSFQTRKICFLPICQPC